MLTIINNNFTKIFLFYLVSGTLSTPVMADDTYWFGYSWGGMSAACNAYQYNQMSEEDAKFFVKTFLRHYPKFISFFAKQVNAPARLPTSCFTEKHTVALLQEVEKSLSF